MVRSARCQRALVAALILLPSLSAGADEPLWYGGAAADKRRAVMEAALAAAPAHGLDFVIPSVAATSGDAGFNAAALKYVAALGGGVVPLPVLGKDWAFPPPDNDAAGLLAGAIRGDSLPALLETLPPSDPQYRRLMDALARYRAIVQRGGWAVLAPSVSDFMLSPADALALRTRLAAEGYVTGEDTDLVQAVRAFQFTHDLEVDGRIGRATLAELNISASARAAQIAVNLERWRLLPRRVEGRRIVVNVPAARLDVVDGTQAVVQMRVIDGDSKHPTPSFTARITAVTFNPPWNVPASIAGKEMLPQLKRHPSYLADHNMVILDRPGDPFGQTVNWADYRAGRFPFRLQQLPGAKNSLGTVKFEMADPFSVYLHDTPARALFARAVRSLSHGCVRVERPEELAALLLENPSTTDITTAIAAGSTQTVTLPRPMPVYLYYLTVTVGDKQEVNFHPDVYKRDAAIAEALGFNGHEGEERKPFTAEACS